MLVLIKFSKCFTSIYKFNVFIAYVAIFMHLSKKNNAVRIVDIKVPETLDINSPEPITLDCIIIHGNSDSNQLALKWFLGESMIYQWLNGRYSFNQAFKYFFDIDKNIINDVYKPNNMPLVITKKSLNLTGSYRCQADTLDTESSLEKYMLAYIKPNIIMNRYENTENNTLNINCSAENVYPEPYNISMTVNNRSLQHIDERKTNESNLFNISAIYTVFIDKLESRTTFTCMICFLDSELTFNASIKYTKRDAIFLKTSSASKSRIELFLVLLFFVSTMYF